MIFFMLKINNIYNKFQKVKTDNYNFILLKFFL